MSEQETVLAGYIMPHPPIIVPGVNQSAHAAMKTVQSMQTLAADLAVKKPDTVVLISPHAPTFSDYLYVFDEDELSGDLSSFGAPEIYLSFRQDQTLRDRIVSECRKISIEAGALNAAQHHRYGVDRGLDHGAIVPLYFLSQVMSFQLVVLASSALPIQTVYKIGQKIRSAAELLNRKIVIIASGDQSHKANAQSPYGSIPEGAQYDAALVRALEAGDRTALLTIDSRMRQRAAECGYRSIVILCGALKEQAIISQVLSYEAPYGIGYCVAKMEPDPDGQVLNSDPLAETADRQAGGAIEGESDKAGPVLIARKTLELYLTHRETPEVKSFQQQIGDDSLLSRQAGVFVSLKKDGQLRGCIGTIVPTTASVAAEIIQNAISAAIADPRFPPVDAAELSSLVISVDVLEEPEPVQSRSELDPLEFGIIVRQGHQSGVLLPRLEGIISVDDQLKIACRKGAIQMNKPYSIERFRVTRYTEE